MRPALGENDFILIVLTAYTGMRWGEAMRLQRPYCRLDHIQVDWQLREYSGKLERFRSRPGYHC
ncbi:hypothetical protein ACLQ2P_26165 [Actinomadura citrea]|uniref:hypothetical protein n=1 Tax=Actinomadura citrea TaxID=46158 RepID=UPI003CE4EFE3